MIDNPENSSQNPENMDPKNTDPVNAEEEENFATLFENYMTRVKDDLGVGEEVSGEIISMDDSSVFVNTGTKVDGVVNRAELCDESGELPYKVGDVVKLYVISKGDGEIRLSRVIAGPGSENRIYDAHRHAIPVEGKVTETCKGGFRVNIMGKSAFCPVSQMDVAYVENPEEYVGNAYEFLISRIESRGKNIVVSRRELLNRYIAEERARFIENTQPGDIVDARITKLMPYGAFAEVAPGVEGMIHISELGWKRVDKPEEAVSVGDTVKTAVLGLEETKDKSRPVKISLSMKKAAIDPWENISEKYREGDKASGTVNRCADFGAFVELEPGIEGLVHISELSHKRVVRVQDAVTPGETVAVTVKSIDPEARRISLSMKDATGDPWLDIGDTYRKDQTVSGRIEKKETFGYFIELEPGVVGLLPASKIREAPNGGEIEKCKTGDIITLVIESIDAKNRKISLKPADAPESENWKNYRKDPEKYARPAPDTADTGLGALGEKLKSAMKDRKE